MTAAVLDKLIAIVAAVALGWAAGRLRWLGSGTGTDPARVLGNAAFTIFVPALLFRTAARIDFGTLPWRSIAWRITSTPCAHGTLLSRSFSISLGAKRFRSFGTLPKPIRLAALWGTGRTASSLCSPRWKR